MTGPTQRLDLRGLDPPEPMRLALEAIEALAPGWAIELLADREPLLLHRELGLRHHPFAYETCADGFCTIVHRGGEAGAR